MIAWLKNLFKKLSKPQPNKGPVNPPPVVEPPKDLTPLHYLIAMKELGQKEISGSKHNPRIVEYHQATSYKSKNDETAWCASFVNWCLLRAGIKGTNSTMARSFLNFGTPVVTPMVGDIVVFSRGSNPAYGHVGFIAEVPKKGDKTIKVLGGNQSNMVKVSKYSLSTLLGYRRP